MTGARRCVAGVAIAVLSACGRHVVIDPSMVQSRNDPDWIVRSAPTPLVVPSPAPLPVPVEPTR